MGKKAGTQLLTVNGPSCHVLPGIKVLRVCIQKCIAFHFIVI